MDFDQVSKQWWPTASLTNTDAPIRCYSLARPDDGCDVNCGERIASLGKNFKAYSDRRPNDGFGLSQFSLEFESLIINVTAFERPLSILDVPATIDEYDRVIGDKSRNMVRKAERAGYHFKQDAKGDEYLQDIFNIRNSTPTRMGGHAIPEYWKRPASSPIKTRGLCDWHSELFYGVFLDHTMVAYTTLFLFGELAQVNQILGHHDHLNFGIMNLLVRNVVEQLRLVHPQVRAINYLYPDKGTSLGQFKRGIGFNPRRTVVTLAAPTIAQKIQSCFEASRPAAQAIPGKAKQVQKIDLEENSAEFFNPGGHPISFTQLIDRIAIPQGEKVASIGIEGEELDELIASVREHGSGLVSDNAGDLDERVFLIFISPQIGKAQEAIGKQLVQHAARLQPKGWLAIRFPYALDEALASGSLTQDDADIFKSFLLRRFKSSIPSTADYAKGFKGGDFQFRGFLDNTGVKPVTSGGFAWLLLRKVTDR